MPSGYETGDYTAALARYLKDTCTQAEGRVFRPELPRKEQGSMPRNCLIIFTGGGGHMMGNNRLEVFDDIADIVAYGTTRLDSQMLANEAVYALRELAHKTIEGVLLHWARIAGSAKSQIDPETLWPFAIITAQVLHSFP